MPVVRGTKHAAAASYTPVVLPFRNQLLWGSLSSSRSSSRAPSSTGPRTASLLPTRLWGISCRCCTESGSAGHDPRLHWHPGISNHQLHVQAERGRASGQRHAHTTGWSSFNHFLAGGHGHWTFQPHKLTGKNQLSAFEQITPRYWSKSVSAGGLQVVFTPAFLTLIGALTWCSAAHASPVLIDTSFHLHHSWNPKRCPH